MKKMSKIDLYRYQLIMEFLRKRQRWTTISAVANEIGVSWSKAKRELEFLTEHKYIKSRELGKTKRKKYRFNFRRKFYKEVIEKDMS